MKTMIGIISIVTHVGETEMMIMIGIVITIGHAVTDQILLPCLRDVMTVHITGGPHPLAPHHLGANPQDAVGARNLAGGRNGSREKAAPVMITKIEVESSRGFAH
jgi:hypothetical protein